MEEKKMLKMDNFSYKQLIIIGSIGIGIIILSLIIGGTGISKKKKKKKKILI